MAVAPRPWTSRPSNPYHRNKNTVRTTPRKKFGSGPVQKKVAFGRCYGPNNDQRYT